MFRDTVELRETLIEQAEIQRRVAELGREITHDYREKTPLLVAVLTGAAVFHADLIRHIDLKLRMDFVALASYGTNTENFGEVQLIKDVGSSIRDLDVIVVEDIIDTGLTADYLLRNLGSREPASLKTCALLSKSSRREVEVPIDYLGFEIPDEFVVGDGLDYGEEYRNLPFIAVLRTTNRQ